MMVFRVWAPKAERVDLILEDDTIAMQSWQRGWWIAGDRQAEHGMDYGFLLDGGKVIDRPLPDPRSPWQPNGVHGLSRVLDHERFEWTDDNWQGKPLTSGVVYEIHVGTFTPQGDFESAIQRLDALAALGITHVELMPVAEFPGERGWGYDGVDLYAPYHAYGGPQGLKKLVNACHERGLAVILDVVYNHLGPEGNYLGQFGPYFTDRYATPWGEAVNFDGPGSDEVRRFFIDNALMWLRDYHIDALRLDAIHAVVDTSAVHILEELAAEVEVLEAQVGRELTLVAESNLNDPRVVRSREAGGYGIDAQWSDDFHHALHTYLTGEQNGYYADFGSLADLAKSLKDVFVYDGRYSPFRKRRHGRAVTGLPGYRFLGYLQNHDQIGNRALGDRSSHLLNVQQLKLAAAMVLTAPFVPMLFQGEEWGASTPFQFFTDFQDPQLAQAVREGRRKEFETFGWAPEEVPDPLSEAAFQRSKLNWDERQNAPHAELLEWHRRLIDLRSRMPSLVDGQLHLLQVDFDEAKRWLVMERGAVLAAYNFAAEVQVLPFERLGTERILLSSQQGCELTGNGVRLAAESVAILAR